MSLQPGGAYDFNEWLQRQAMAGMNPNPTGFSPNLVAANATPEVLPFLQRWAADLVASNMARRYEQTGLNQVIPCDCIVDAFASYLDLFGKRLVVICLAVPPDEASYPVCHALMVIGFTERGLERLSLFRGSNHRIEVNAPECVQAVSLLFGQQSVGHG